jgi:hypothetical protein
MHPSHIDQSVHLSLDPQAWMTDFEMTVLAGARLAKLDAARRRANSSAIREEVGGGPAQRQTRHPRVPSSESFI